jgi:hypothetical protein
VSSGIVAAAEGPTTCGPFVCPDVMREYSRAPAARRLGTGRRIEGLPGWMRQSIGNALFIHLHTFRSIGYKLLQHYPYFPQHKLHILALSILSAALATHFSSIIHTFRSISYTFLQHYPYFPQH